MKVGSERGTVEDMRGKKVTDRSVMRYGRSPFSRMKKTLIPDIKSAVAAKQTETFAQRLDKKLGQIVSGTIMALAGSSETYDYSKLSAAYRKAVADKTLMGRKK
jgi:hypothetical protein